MSETTTMTFMEAIRETMAREMRRDESVFLLGENIATRGGSAGVTEGLVDEFGEVRVRETPVSENAIVGSALGAALDGLRPIAEIYHADFFYTVGNEVINDIPKWRYQHRQDRELPIVLRGQMGIPPGGGSGPEHSQCPEAYLHHAPGLTIAIPGTPADASGLLRTAIRGGDPVIFLEHKRLYERKGEVPDDPDFTVPLREAAVRRTGEDLTIVAWSWMLTEAERAAERLADRGIDAEVVDPRTVKPFDFDTVVDSVRNTGRLLLAEETPKTGSISAEVITRVVESEVPLDATPRRLTYPNIPHPYNPGLEDHYLPQVDDIVEAGVSLVRGDHDR